MRLMLAALLTLPCLATARTLSVGTTLGYDKPSQAMAAAQAGDTIEIQPGQYYDCGVLQANDVTIEGVGPPAGVVLTDKTCQGKALLIIDGAGDTVRNLTLTRARVPDGNGAGIRAEGGSLTVDGVRFINNEEGILGAATRQSTILVENSFFDRNGICLQACAHAIYVNRIALLRVIHSHFTDTRDGHDIKSRAARTEVVDNVIEDGPTGTSSYLIEAPNGGGLLVSGNTLEKGPHTGNRTAAIEIGAEGVDQATPEITVTGNNFTNDTGHRAALLYNVTATEARLEGNHTSGAVDLLKGDGTAN